MENVMQYKCPACGGVLAFDSSLQLLKCPYCDSTFTVDEFSPGQDAPFSNDSSQATYEFSHEEFAHGEAPEFAVFRCDSCGAEIIADESTAATSCPYCSNNIVFTGRLSGELKPDYIIPFRYDKKAAREALKNHFSEKKLLPKVFSSENHLDEIKGIYVPFWLFDADAEAEGTYKATKVRTWSDMRFQYTETSHFTLFRRCGVSFAGVPVDAALSIPNELTESLEIFEYSGLTEFNPAYLSGYFANKYDVSSDECLERAKERIFKSAESRLDSTVSGYATVSRQSGNVRLRDVKIKYALFPVWILNTTWRGKRYTFSMNGQTGKFVGNLPVDRLSYWKYRLLYTGIFGVLLYAASWAFINFM